MKKLSLLPFLFKAVAKVLVLILSCEAILNCSAAMSPDGLSLLAFKAAVSGDPSSSLASWDETDTDPCRWSGVTCANVTGDTSPRVVSIAVSSKNLTGYIPSELGSLIYLRRLNLHGNLLSGAIPTQLFNATSLHSIFLYDNNLSGGIPPSICNLQHLQNLDLSGNILSGSIPPYLRRCRQLQRLILARNNLSGEIPAGVWPQLQGLMLLDLSSNKLSGEIPAELGSLGSLGGTLNLSRNHLTGEIPSSLGRLPAAVSLDLRFNNLSGEIPQAGSLANQGPTAFLNNPGLCGFPLQNSCTPPSPVTPSSRRFPPTAVVDSPEKKGLKPNMIVLISIADAAGVALIGLVLVYAYWKLKDNGKGSCSCTGTKRLGGNERDGKDHVFCTCWRRGSGGVASEEGEEEEEEEGDGKHTGNGSEGNEGELVALDKGFSFELDELFRASAYVLGKSGTGIVYKVVLGSGIPVAVRRLGGGSGGGQRYKEFLAEAQAIGRVKHPNVVRLRAYYWAQDEKLLISDFVSNGNLATALRGRSGQTTLSWALRLKIAKGSARGLAHIHECSPRKYVHGEIKPTNILLDSDYNPFISDFGLLRLITVAGADISAASGSGLGYLGASTPSSATANAIATDKHDFYKPPESRMLQNAKPTQKWDVYSFGVVLLELLTGKTPEFSSPSSSSTVVKGSPPAAMELVSWVNKGFEDVRPLSEMIDVVLLREAQAKKEMISVFHVALACTETDPEARPRMKTIVEILDRVGR